MNQPTGANSFYMDGKILSSFFGSLSSYVFGLYVQHFNFISVDEFLMPNEQIIAARDTITFYLQNVAFCVTIIAGMLTIWLTIRKLSKSKQQ